METMETDNEVVDMEEDGTECVAVDVEPQVGEGEAEAEADGDVDADGEGDEIIDDSIGKAIIPYQGNPFQGLPYQVGGNLEPYEGMEFDSDEAAKSFYDAYGRRMGFGTRLRSFYRSKRDGVITSRQFVCAREGFRLDKDANNEAKSKQPNSMTRVGCKAMIIVKKQNTGRWVVSKFQKDHNHAMGTPMKIHSVRQRRPLSGTPKHFSAPPKHLSTPPKHYPGSAKHFTGAAKHFTGPAKHFTGTAKSPMGTFQWAGLVPIGIMPMCRDDPRGMGNPGFTERDYRNYIKTCRQRTLGKDAQYVLEYFKRMQAENPSFFYAIQVDENQCVNNIFWADARSRMAYDHFGDVVTFDTTYKANQYRIPFAPFTGFNHHRQPVLFGCALLLDESEASFIWLFKTWLAAMSGRHPTSIITDQDRAIRAAVSHVFPGTRHRFCKWHILREGQEKLGHVYRTHPTFQAEFHKCIHQVETVDEFESSWESLLDKFELKENEWLQSLYNARRQWVPVYLRDTFFAELPSMEGTKSFFDGYINAETTLQAFFKQYENALERGYRKEVEADLDTISTTPVLKTPSPMEKQAADVYTRKIFEKFQEEFFETFVYTANEIEEDGTISTYRVAKFEEDEKAYTVTVNISEMSASCSCQMFEFSGILCRHVLTVFGITNVFTLPPHYILKRWTRNAKSVVVPDEQGIELERDCQESLTLRYNKLCHEAIKYAEEAAICIDTYNVAISALREGVKRVIAAKKNVDQVALLATLVGPIPPEEITKKPVGSTSQIPHQMWARQDDASRRFNLNDVGAPVAVADSNLPHMDLVSLQRDEGPPDNLVILPRLKSMTWIMENRNSTPANRVAVINLKLQDPTKTPIGESEVKFQLSKDTLEAMLRSMTYISEQLSTPANRVAVINLKLQDYNKTPSGETDVKFLLSRDTLDAMLRSLAYIREQLSNVEGPPSGPLLKKQRL